MIRVCPSPRWLAIGLVLIAGCSPPNAPRKIGVGKTPPLGWRPVPATTWPVPGEAVEAWSVPEGGAVVLYRRLPVPGGDAASYAEALANRLENLPGMNVLSRGTVKLGGLDAARVEVVAPGTGETIAPSGTGTPIGPNGATLKPTRAVFLAVLRPADTVCVDWHSPDAAFATLAPQWDAFLQSLTINQGRLTTSSY